MSKAEELGEEEGADEGAVLGDALSRSPVGAEEATAAPIWHLQDLLLDD